MSVDMALANALLEGVYTDRLGNTWIRGRASWFTLSDPGVIHRANGAEITDRILREATA